MKYFKFNGMIEVPEDITDDTECEIMFAITDVINKYGENYVSAQVITEDALDAE